VRIGKRVTQVYVGRGRAGEVAAAAVALRRRQREAAARELAAEEAGLREVEASVLEAGAWATVLARVELVVRGYHQHDRGEWRKRRRAPEPPDQVDPGTAPDPETTADPRQVLGALAGLSVRAERGDPAALCELRRTLARSSGVWQAAADLAGRVEEALIERASGTNLLLAESMRFRLRDLKHEMGGLSPSPAERLVIESLVASWVWLNHLDALTLQAEDPSLPRVRLLLSLVGAAHRRHIAAVRLLRTLGRLLKPPPSSFGLAGRLDRTPPRPVGAARAVAGTVPVTN
jgi:hypothetical protein